jgi:hypothetical protein
MKLVVPSSGSMIQRYSACSAVVPDPRRRSRGRGRLAHDLDDRLLGRAVHLGDEIVGAFRLTTSASPPSAARLMIEPARRAARTAMFSIDAWGPRILRAVPRIRFVLCAPVTPQTSAPRRAR